MEENSDIKGPTTRRSLRLSIDCDNVSSPATPTKKKAARVAAKPLLDHIKEDTPVNSPKPSRRRSTARDLDDEKPVTPSRRSTRIRSNTSLVLETVLQSAADSPRAKRAARRNSFAGSDNEAPSTPVKTTRRTRKDSTSSIENNEPAASKPVIEETITEEPENQAETLSPNIALDSNLTSRKSPRLARWSKKSGEFDWGVDKNVTPNTKNDKSKKTRGKQSKTPESIKKPDGDKIPSIVITPIKSSKSQSDGSGDTPNRQRTKSWTTISNDIVEYKEINQSLNTANCVNETGDFFDNMTGTKPVASLELLQDNAPKNIQCDIYFENSNSNGDTRKDIIDNLNNDHSAHTPSQEIETSELKSDKFVTNNSSHDIFAINLKPQNLSCEPMDVDETILEMKVDNNASIKEDLKEPYVKSADSASSSFKMDVSKNTLNKNKNRNSSLSMSMHQLASDENNVSNTYISNNSLNKSKSRKSSLSKSINECIDQLASEDNIVPKETHKEDANNSLNKIKNRKSSLSKSINECIDQQVSEDNIVRNETHKEDTNNSLNKIKNRKSSLSKSLNECIDQQVSEDNIVRKETHKEDTNNSLNKIKNKKSSLSKSLNECIDQQVSEDNIVRKETHKEDDTNNSLNKIKNRKSSLSKSINECIDQQVSEDNIVRKETHKEDTNNSLNKIKNRKSSLSKSLNECIDQQISEDNIVCKETHKEDTNNSLNKIKNKKSSLSKSLNECIDQQVSEDNIVRKETHKEDDTNNSLNKNKNRKSSLSKSINECIDQQVSEDNIVRKETHKEDDTNNSLNKNKKRKSSLSKSINECIDQQAVENKNLSKVSYGDYTNDSLNNSIDQKTFEDSHNDTTNNSLSKSKNRKLSLSRSLNESIDQQVSNDNIVPKNSHEESGLNESLKSKKISPLSKVQALKQPANETSSLKVSDETNFGEYTDNKTFNNAKSNISFDETDCNLSICKGLKKKSSLTNSKSINLTENENKSTLILSRVDDSTNENSMSKSLKAPLNTSSILDHHKKRNISDIQDNTPLRNKTVKGLGLQTSTPVVGDQKGSKSKKPEVSEIDEKSSSYSESDKNESSSEVDSSEDQVEITIFFDEAEDAGDDYESGDSDAEENDSEEEDDDSEEESDTEDEDISDNDNNKALKPINEVHVNENVSISRLEATSDPLQDNEDDSASLCSENEEITKGYDSILSSLNKSINKNKHNNLSLNVDKKAVSKENILIDQLNLTQTKNRKTKSKDKVNEDKELQIIKAPSNNGDSDLSSLDIHLLYSDSNSGDDKHSQDYIPLKRSFGATNLHDEPENSTVINESTKKIEVTGKDTKKYDTSAGRVSRKEENQNVTNSTKKTLSESKLQTLSKVNKDKSIKNAAGVNQVMTAVEKSNKRKRIFEPQDEIENRKEQPVAEKANSKKPKRNTSIIEDPQPRRSKRKAIDDNDVGNNNKKRKILKENRMENIHIPRLAPAILEQLEGTSENKSVSAKASKVVSTSNFVIEETVKRQLKPSQYLEQSIHLDTDSPDKIVSKKRAPLPKVLPFLPTAVTSSQGFTTRFQISVLPKETKFTAQTSNTKNFKNDYLFGKNIKRMGTYALYKKNRNNKLSKF